MSKLNFKDRPGIADVNLFKDMTGIADIILLFLYAFWLINNEAKPAECSQLFPSTCFTEVSCDGVLFSCTVKDFLCTPYSS